jgi:hypothetical protein
MKGSGLDIRELENQLVISTPGHPEMGRIYITYKKGEVSHRRTVWDYLGYLDGCGDDSEKTEPGVTAETIIGILAGQDRDALSRPGR